MKASAGQERKSRDTEGRMQGREEGRAGGRKEGMNEGGGGGDGRWRKVGMAAGVSDNILLFQKTKDNSLCGGSSGVSPDTSSEHSFPKALVSAPICPEAPAGGGWEWGLDGLQGVGVLTRPNPSKVAGLTATEAPRLRDKKGLPNL